MKVYYFNERPANMVVQVQTWGLAVEEKILEAHKGAEFDDYIPRGHMLFVKEFGYNVVILSSRQKDRN